MLYLLVRLTGEAGCGAVCTPLAPGGKRAGGFVTGRKQKARSFSESGSRYTTYLVDPLQIALKSQEVHLVFDAHKGKRPCFIAVTVLAI